MKQGQQWLVAMVVAAAALGMGMGAVGAEEAAIYDWHGDQAPVLVVNESGLILLGTDGDVLRAFSWDANEASDVDRPLRLVDMDGDEKAEIVGSGEPTFVLDPNGIPIFSLEDGCTQVVVADVIDGTPRDLVCVRRDQVRLYTNDGQFAWSVGNSRGLEYCRAGDVTNNTKNDVECKIRGADRFLRVDGEGEVRTDEGETERLEDESQTGDEASPVGDGILAGDESFDLGADLQGLTFSQAEGTIELHQSGQDEPVKSVDVDGPVVAAMVKDLAGEGASSLVAVTAESIYVVDGGDEVRQLTADADGYTRVPHAEFASVYANNFGDEQQAAQDAVSAEQEAISQCYSSRVRANPYAGSGRQLLQVTIAEDGSVERVMQRHADVGDDQVEECAQQAIEGIDFPATAGGPGSVSVNIMFSFRDE